VRITLRQLELFSAVARSGSTAAAGEEVSLSQSAVSAAINDLEQSLGLQMFDRVGKRLVLNDLGRALFGRAARMLDCARGIEKDFSNAGSLAHLKIAASTTIGNYLIPELLASYIKNHPQARVDVQIGNSEDVVKAVSDFKVDAGVIEGPSRVSGLNLTHWRDDELVLVAAPHHVLALLQRESGSAIEMECLKRATWLFREEGSGTRDAAEAVLFPHLGEIVSSMVLGSSEAIKRAVSLGLGISCLSRLLVRDMLEAGTLVELIGNLPTMVRPLYIVVHPERNVSAAVSVLLRRSIASTTDST
jgi:DNA-binding transcriptional LysR family regulator